MTSVPWAFTKTSWVTWEDTADQPGLLAGAHWYPDKYWGTTSTRREPWTRSALLEVTKASVENRFSCRNKPFQERQELCTEFTSYPRCSGTDVLQLEPVPELEHGPFPLPCCCRTQHNMLSLSDGIEGCHRACVIWYLWGICTVRLIWNWLV